MKVRIPKSQLGNPRVGFSRLGYHLGRGGSYEKRLSRSEFPRYHVYVELHDEDATVSLHCDLKPHTYEGFSAHVGDYESDDIQQEMSRIVNFFSQGK